MPSPDNDPNSNSDPALSPARFGDAFKAFMDAVLEEVQPPGRSVIERLKGHLGTDPTDLPIVTEEFDSFEHPNLQVALDDRLRRDGRTSELVGAAADAKRFMAIGLSDLLSRGGPWGRGLVEGPVDYVNFRLADERTLACVQFGLFLVSDGDARVVVFVAGPSDHGGPRQKLRVEAMAARPEDGRAFLAELTEAMRRLNVYRGQVISLSPGELGMGPQALVAFHALPKVAREDVILPDGLMERVERHTVVFAEHAERLLAAGRSLRRGLLLHGQPGTGKTTTVLYLIGRMPGRTVLLTTGFGMGLLRPVVQMARTLAPAMVVLEDVDLIAEERGRYLNGGGSLLFELLNEMDGLREDSDVIFVLTTNRPDVLEPALAARPGRIDLAVELPLPDAAGRLRLLGLYAKGLELDGVDLPAVAGKIDGATPAFVKELLRRAAVLSAAGGTFPTVTAVHVEDARKELVEAGLLARRIIGFGRAERD